MSRHASPPLLHPSRKRRVSSRSSRTVILTSDQLAWQLAFCSVALLISRSTCSGVPRNTSHSREGNVSQILYVIFNDLVLILCPNCSQVYQVQLLVMGESAASLTPTRLTRLKENNNNKFWPKLIFSHSAALITWTRPSLTAEILLPLLSYNSKSQVFYSAYTTASCQPFQLSSINRHIIIFIRL